MTPELLAFILQAKLHTYASGGDGSERNLPDGGHEMLWAAEDWSYRDVYYGYNPFAGEEMIWQGGKAVWMMNYYGRVASEEVTPQEVYAFLQKAMQKVGPEAPYRGPLLHLEGDFEYRDENRGDPDGFHGVERIYFRGRQVYELMYHGGILA